MSSVAQLRSRVPGWVIQRQANSKRLIVDICFVKLAYRFGIAAPCPPGSLVLHNRGAR